MRTVEVVPHHPRWKNVFEIEAMHIAQALGDNIVQTHHIGSTSIPSIYAKPIIDMMVEVRAIAQVDTQAPAMVKQGYEAMGEYGIPGRRYFRKDNAAGIRIYHVHVFEVGSEQIERHLAFRDYMRAHPDDAQAYSELKQQLAKAHPMDIDAYCDGKDGFIQAMDAKAAEWRSHGDKSS
ncbi:MAG: GrpB family protein [Cyanobacteria bacterium P01_F01_bin.150]